MSAESQATIALLSSGHARDVFLETLRFHLAANTNNNSNNSTNSSDSPIVAASPTSAAFSINPQSTFPSAVLSLNFAPMEDMPLTEMLFFSSMAPLVATTPSSSAAGMVGQRPLIDDIILIVIVEGDAASLVVAEERLSEISSQPHAPVMLVSMDIDPTTATLISGSSPVNTTLSLNGPKDTGREKSLSREGPNALKEGLFAKLEKLDRFYGVVHLVASPSPSKKATSSPAFNDSTSSTMSQQQQQHQVHSFLSHCLTTIASPRHIVWNRHAGQLTPQGLRLFKRAFWLLDRDEDGWLCKEELNAWYEYMYDGAEDTELSRDLQALRKHEVVDENASSNSAISPNYKPRGDGRYIDSQGRVSLSGFLLLTRAALRHGGPPAIAQWCLLSCQNVQPDGMPFTLADLQAAQLPDDESVYQLSQSGIRFFDNLYTRSAAFQQNFAASSEDRDSSSQRKASSSSSSSSCISLWDIAPDCPWSNVQGLPQPTRNGPPLSRLDFVQCWRFMATRNPALVVEFARYWNYQGSPSQLFVPKKKRQFRKMPNDFPNTIQVLVIGSQRSGKSSLIRRLTTVQRTTSGGNGGASSSVASSYASAYQVATNSGTRSISLVPVRMEGGYDFLVAYQELDSKEDNFFVQNAAQMSQVDCVLLCYDGSDPYSFSYLEGFFGRLKVYQPSLPLVMCLTKTDLPLEDQISVQSPEIACKKRGLVWPPVLTSAVAGDRLEGLGCGNQVDALNEMLVDVVKCPDVSLISEEERVRLESARRVTPLRLVRRAVIVTALVVGIFYGGRAVMRRMVKQ